MNDFVFYKKRKFGDLISDTFTFFRKYAGNYFSNYLVINGAAIVSAGILFTVMVFFLPSLSGGIGTSLLLVLLMLVIVFFLFLFVFCFPIQSSWRKILIGQILPRKSCWRVSKK